MTMKKKNVVYVVKMEGRGISKMMAFRKEADAKEVQKYWLMEYEPYKCYIEEMIIY